MASRYQKGEYLDYTPDAAVTGGDVVVVGARALVADTDIAADALGALATAGVYGFTRAATSGADVDAGTIMYWDASGEEPTVTEGSNAKIGYAYGDLVATDTTWYIELAA